MIIYCYILITVFLLSLGQAIGTDDKPGYVLSGILMVLPLIGKVLGWW